VAFLVTCTFDLKNASSTDYQNAYADLAKLGLKKAIVADNGNTIVAPTTMTIGTFNGQSSAAVRDDLRNRVQAAFKLRAFKSEIFVVVGDNWTWGAATT
jgi:hypothetical protein